MACTTPVLFIIFNRPDLTAIVFEAIRAAQPAKLYIAADGPRTAEEQTLTDAARAVVAHIDWPCELQRNYSAQNMGAKYRPSSAISWIFEQEETAIILEDDCLPDPSFFDFCTTMLQRYMYNEEVMHVSGNNFQNGQVWGDGDYYFSKYTHIWGWATWKRAWKKYDPEIQQWPNAETQKAVKRSTSISQERKYWFKIFQEVYDGTIKSCWDYQWLLATWCHGGKAILPNQNIVKNIGFRPDATHTKIETKLSMNILLGKLESFNSPSNTDLVTKADAFTFFTCFQSKAPTFLQRILRKIKRELSSLV